MSHTAFATSSKVLTAQTVKRSPRASPRQIVCSARPSTEAPPSRREILLASINVGVLGSVFSFGAAPRPSTIGVRDYGGGVKSLALCPPTPNCISTAEELNDPTHYVPPLTYQPVDRRGNKGTKTKEEAMKELEEVVSTLQPDNFTPKLVTTTDDYVYVEYQSPTFGFVDDVEFWFGGKPGEVEYRSASRLGESDFNINRKRIKAIRLELQKKGWESVGF